MMTQLEQQTMIRLKAACSQFVESATEIDWEQRRYEIARDICNGIVARVGLNVMSKIIPVSEFAVAFADALIKELKKTINNLVTNESNEKNYPLSTYHIDDGGV